MIEIGALLLRLPYLAIGALVLIGVVVALRADALMKRLAGLAMAQAALLVFLAAVGGGDPSLQAFAVGAAALFAASLALGAALLVRVREAYGDAEAAHVDAVDDAGDAPRDAPRDAPGDAR